MGQEARVLDKSAGHDLELPTGLESELVIEQAPGRHAAGRQRSAEEPAQAGSSAVAAVTEMAADDWFAVVRWGQGNAVPGAVVAADRCDDRTESHQR